MYKLLKKKKKKKKTTQKMLGKNYLQMSSFFVLKHARQGLSSQQHLPRHVRKAGGSNRP
jgi:hypothetical protein